MAMEPNEAPEMTLSVQDVVDSVECLRERVSTNEADPEDYHIGEKGLWHVVLRSIADETCDDPRACAAAALETLDIDFPRWFA